MSDCYHVLSSLEVSEAEMQNVNSYIEKMNIYYKYLSLLRSAVMDEIHYKGNNEEKKKKIIGEFENYATSSLLEAKKLAESSEFGGVKCAEWGNYANDLFIP